MRVSCLHLPRQTSSIGAAFYTTKWGWMNSNFFMTQLDELSAAGSDPFSLEFYAKDGTIYACMAGGEKTIETLTTGMYGYYPDLECHPINDYTHEITERTMVAGTDMYLEWPDIYPIQTFRVFVWSTLWPIFAALSRIGEGDRMLIQIIVKPLEDTSWLHLNLAMTRYYDRIMKPFRTKTWLKKDLLNDTKKLMNDKALSRLFKVNYRITTFAEVPERASTPERARIKGRLISNVRNLANTVKFLNAFDENKFGARRIKFGKVPLLKAQTRSFDRPFRLSTVEVSTLWNPPTLGGLPNTAMVLSKKAPPPPALPATPEDPQISFFGETSYRSQSTKFGIRRFDRRRHLYVLGKSGNGKSCLLQLLAKSDIENGFGCAILDPHGDLVDDVLRLIPKYRLKDVVIFDPSDVKHPPSFNPMIPINPDQKMRVTLGFLDTFKKVFGDSWSEKMDHVLRYAVIALLNVPGASIVSLRRLLSDDEFRSQVVRRNPDEAVRRFWEVEFVARRQEFEEGPISQLLNRLDELLATDMIRNILGQPTNAFDFREFIDSRKIVLFKVSKGILGAENASLLGSLIIWKIYEAAMSRADTAVDQRQDFYFYVDEFQNFATSSFGEILSESRKYRLCLTFANQFLSQMPSGVKETVFGNIANLLCFRVGAEDAATVAGEFKPRFGAEDLLNLPLREFYVKMSIDGEVQEAFSGRTLDVTYAKSTEPLVQECIAQSRAKYSIPLAQAEEQLALSEIMSPRIMGGR